MDSDEIMMMLLKQQLWRCILLAACLPGVAMAASIQALNYSSREVNYIAVENPGNTAAAVAIRSVHTGRAGRYAVSACRKSGMWI